jgi:hypothetical protein
MVALFDESDAESEDGEGEVEVDSVSPSMVSSTGAQASQTEPGELEEALVSEPLGTILDYSTDTTPERPNPLLHLDDDDESNATPQLCAASSQSESSRSAAVSHVQATSKLSCPLADVVSTKGNSVSPSKDGKDPLEVYHLTFYSRKIGIQFQRVPPPPPKANGLLTEAMTADLKGQAPSDRNTASELRRIAAFTSKAKSEAKEEEESTCQVATPVDAVIVCGFQNFDDSGNNVRPKLGARLVAFDGVSVEVGKWTFDAVRKSIQARGRPLTLSFRNDFLTSEQRKILTKAVKDMEASALPPRRSIEYRLTDRPSSATPSMQSGLSHESHFVNDGRSAHSHEDDSSVSVNSDHRNFMPQSFSGSRSVSSGNGRYQSFSEARSVSSAKSNYRSFSEAGSSTSVLSAVAPLVSNLLTSRREPFTPEYLRRAAESVEETPQHQDFKSELL